MLRSKREQIRIFNNSTADQQRFLYLPKHVLLRATNFKQLVRAAAAAERGGMQLEHFVDDIFKELPNIDRWIPALSNLKFKENLNADSNDENLVENQPHSTRLAASTTSTPRELRKRKVVFKENNRVKRFGYFKPAH